MIFKLLLLLHIYLAFAGWIDPDTSPQSKILESFNDGRKYNLVFSDEFEINDRLFKDGYDPKWTSINKNDYTNFALQYYNDNLIRTKDGKLVISSIIEDITYPIFDSKKMNVKETKNYQAGMLQGWNKFCFTGGIIEISAKLPGQYDIGGLWPAMWLLGNLARATFVASSNNVWPWSYNKCNPTLQHRQAISACNIVNHYDLLSKNGRGAPEVDILEAMPGKEELINTPINKPYFSSSYQVAPGFQDYRPDVATNPAPGMWYEDGITYSGDNDTSLNIFFYGMNLEGITPAQSYTADAISANTNLYETHFNDFHTYRLEWIPGENGYLTWHLDGKFLYGIHADAFNKTGAMIPEEPMYIILNTAISSTWGFPTPCPEGCPCDCFDARKFECACAVPSRMSENFPNEFLIEYVRVYQAEDDKNQIIGCSTKSHPTKKYIQGHVKNYMSDGDKVPLLPVQKGGAACTTDDQCGFGICSNKKKCECNSNSTGPSCLAYNAYDDIIWDTDDSVDFHGFLIQSPIILFCIFLLITSFVVVAYKLYDRRNDLKYRSKYVQLNSSGILNENIYSKIQLTGVSTREKNEYSSNYQYKSSNN